jgi:hypothetical protein
MEEPPDEQYSESKSGSIEPTKTALDPMQANETTATANSKPRRLLGQMRGHPRAPH